MNNENIYVVNITTTFNNIIINVSDKNGNTIIWCSAGKAGLKGSKKSTSYSGQIVSEHCIKKMKELNIKNIEIKISGPGQGRDSSIRNFYLNGFKIISITDVTGIPHNGCRPKKTRRI